MNYASIEKCECRNGEGWGTSLFVSGCDFQCEGCFNKEAWNYNFGEELTDKTISEITENTILMAKRGQISRFSLLGGEPLASNNLTRGILRLLKNVKPYCKVWIYTGFTYEEILKTWILSEPNTPDYERYELLKLADVLVDGRFVDELKDFRLKFRGSSNQRIIDVQKSLKEGKVILYME